MMIASRVVVVGLGTQYIYTERKTFFPSSYKETCKGLYNIIREKDYDTEENIRTEEKQEHSFSSSRSIEMTVEPSAATVVYRIRIYYRVRYGLDLSHRVYT